MAGDIAVRLEDLRDYLGLKQLAFAKLFGRGRKQASAWKHRKQAPPAAVLEWAAEQHGWPLEMFEEGGPMPSKALKRLLTPSNGDQPPSAKGQIVNLGLTPLPPTVDEVWATVADQLAGYRAAGKVPPLNVVFRWLAAAREAKPSSHSDE